VKMLWKELEAYLMNENCVFEVRSCVGTSKDRLSSLSINGSQQNLLVLCWSWCQVLRVSSNMVGNVVVGQIER